MLRRLPKPLLALLPALALHLGADGLRAQGSGSVSVSLLSDRVAVGEFGQIFITIRNGDARMPERIDVEGLEVVYSGNRFVGSARAVEATHYYRYRAAEPGTYTIPAFEIRVGNRAETVGPIAVTIVERSASEALDATKPFFAKLELPRDTFYAGEIVPFTVSAYVRGRNSIHEIASAKFENESFVIKGFREVRTDGAEVGRVYYSSATVPSHLFALKPGDYRLGPAEITVRALDADAGFGGLSQFFQRTTAREMVTNTVNVSVKALPEGAPTSFTGGVGRFELSATPSTTTLAVGDPVSMEFEVKGVGNLRTMGAPVFAIPQTGIWKSYEPSKSLDDAEDSDGFSEGRVRFSRVILLEAAVEAIPEFQLAYFDPAQDQYVVLRTDPVPITLLRDRAADSPTSTAGAGEVSFGGAFPTARRPEPAYSDILHIRTGRPRWVASAIPGRAGALFWTAQVLLSVAFCTLVGLGLAKWIGERRAGRSALPERVPFSRAVKRLPPAGSPRRDFFEAVAAALESWRREHPEAPAKLLAVVSGVAERCDAALYSGRDDGDRPVAASEAEEIASLLRRLPVR
jgi:hypothetical protein